MSVYSVNGKEPTACWIPSLDTAGNGTTTLTDLVGTSHGTLTNMDPATDWATDTGSGGVRALDFDGVNDYVLLPNLAAATNWTISAWIYVTSLAQYPAPVLIKFGTVPANGIVANTTTTWMTLRNDGAPALRGVARTQNVWTHLIATWNGTITSIFKDTVQGSSGAGGGGYGIADSRIGDGYSTDKFKGRIDDIRVFNSVLDSSDISYLYGDGVGRGRVAVSETRRRRQSVLGGVL